MTHPAATRVARQTGIPIDDVEAILNAYADTGETTTTDLFDTDELAATQREHAERRATDDRASDEAVQALRNALIATTPPRSEFGPVIHTVTRADLLESGDLIELGDDLKRDAGIRGSVAMTLAAHADVVAWDEADNTRKGTAQDATGRAWDVLWMLKNRLAQFSKVSRVPEDGVTFQLYRVPREGRGVKARLVTLKAMLGADDEGRPAITIMMPGED
jgi:hypothetical protein